LHIHQQKGIAIITPQCL